MKLRNKNTGEIIEFEFTTHESRDFMNHVFEEWENVPQEPLIKDEKIRKAVRAWAEANDIGVVKLRQDKHRLLDSNVGIEFDTYFFEELQDGWNYTIAELCGEEDNEN